MIDAVKAQGPIDGGADRLRRLCDYHLVSASHVHIEDDGKDTFEHPNRKDEEYAKFVKGAMVNGSISVVWTPADEMENSKIDDESFTDVMWTYLRGYVKKLGAESVGDEGRDPSRNYLANMIKKVKSQMKHVWSDAQNFGVSNEVFMVEVEVVHRLLTDRALTRPPAGGGVSHWIEDCIRFMRRDDRIRYQFASCVGKRILTERVISRGRTSIIEHHRSVSWGEREYKALYTLVVSLKSAVATGVQVGGDNTKDFQLAEYDEVRKRKRAAVIG